MAADTIDLSEHPYFSVDATGHLDASFDGGRQLLMVEPITKGYHCYLSQGDSVFAEFVTDDAREVLALALAMENNVSAENGKDTAGFGHLGTHIHNPFADPVHGDWTFGLGSMLKDPRVTYGAAYDGWLSEIAEAWHGYAREQGARGRTV